MKEEKGKNPHSYIAEVCIDEIIILSQMRKTYDDIDQFAKEILETGEIFQNIVIAELSYEKAKEYIAYINIVCGSNKSIKEFGTREKYKIVIAGHRRMKACKKLDKKGNFVKISPHRTMTARIFPDIDVRTALKMQNIENKRKDIKPIERAEHLQNWYAIEQILDGEKKLSMKEFSLTCGESVREISRAVLFARLPDEIKEAVMTKNLSYPRACELARIYRLKKVSDVERKNIITKTITDNGLKGKELRKYISNLMRSEYESAAPLFDKEERIKVKTGLRKSIVRLIGIETWKAHSASISMYKRIFWLYENNFLNFSESPYLLRDIRKILKSHLDVFEKLRNHLKDVLKKKEYENSKKTNAAIRLLLKGTKPHVLP